MSAFSALHLLRSYNHLFLQDFGAYGTVLPLVCPQHILPSNAVSTLPNTYASKCGELKSLLSSRDSLPPDPRTSAVFKSDSYEPLPSEIIINPTELACASIVGSPCNRTALSCTTPTGRIRGEKRPIPEEQKDERYFERRKRNNRAAKKSRDARKMREDQIALRASILEHENALLRAQLATMREEAASLRQLLTARELQVAMTNQQPDSSQT